MSTLTILVLNSGSSSIKFSLYEAGTRERRKQFEGAVDGIGTTMGKFWVKDAAGNKIIDESPSLPTRAVAFALVAEALNSPTLPTPVAIGHRVVSGGPKIRENQRVTPELIDELERCTAFAPLHLPIAIYILREALKLFPGVLNFICLDTYFHRTLPVEAYTLPIAPEYAEMGVRRYGYHGLSYESIVHQLKPRVPEKLIVAHLGNGASITAIHHGKSVDTSMGLTPTGGLISGTRTGDLDPGVLLFILRKIAEKKSDSNAAADELEAVAGKRAGLLGVSGLSNDMRSLREAISGGNEGARLAVELFTRSIAKFVGSYVAVLGGLNMLVFTGGIGENDMATRAEVCANLGGLEINLNAERNNSRGEAIISAEDSRVSVRVIPPAEDLMIVNHVVRMLGHPVH